ncbi:hypothetical protein Aduo_001497 [Ancylostoma duodenale]
MSSRSGTFKNILGIAYATIVGVDPVYGLYSSCFPAFFYMLFGTSRHVSVGGFAVVALMAGVAIDKIMATRGEGTVEFLRTSKDNPFDVITDRHDISPIQVATMLTFSIGIWEIVCAVLRLQFLMAYFSDPLVSGFTSGAAVHVLLSQFGEIMGVRVPKASGLGYIFVKVCDLAARVHNVNFTAFIVSAAAMSFLYVEREFLSPFLVRKFKFNLPIPYELILVATTATLSKLLQWHEKNSLEIIGEIPAG